MYIAGIVPESGQAAATLVAEGGTCTVKLEKAILHGCGVVIRKGALLTAIECSSRNAHGDSVCVQDAGSSVNARYCTFADNQECGVNVSSGGKAELYQCTFSGSKKSHGLAVQDACSFANALHCTFADNQRAGVMVCGTGKATLEECQCSSISCRHTGSEVKAVKCKLDKVNVHKYEGGVVVIKGNFGSKILGMMSKLMD